MSGHLADRWTHAEREGIASGRLGRGDISAWAKPTSGFRRPEVEGRPPISTPCKSLHEYGMSAIEAPHKPSEVYLPIDAKPDPRLDMGRANVIATVSGRLTDHAIKCRKKRAKQKPDAKPVDLLADCPKTGADVLDKLKDKMIERDCELFTDKPLPYDRATKASGWRR